MGDYEPVTSEPADQAPAVSDVPAEVAVGPGLAETPVAPTEPPGAAEEPVALAEPLAEEPFAAVPPSEGEPVAEELAVEVDAIAAIQEQLSLEPEPQPEAAAEIETAVEVAQAETSDDDLAAAVAASEEQVGVESTLDDIVPETAHAEIAEVVPELSARYGAPWWPFLVYLGLWFVFAGVGVWQMQKLPTGQVIFEAQLYTWLLYAALGLLAAGPLLILVVWVAARFGSSRHKSGLLSSAMIKGATMTLLGAIVWWGTLIAVDYLRLGRWF